MKRRTVLIMAAWAILGLLPPPAWGDDTELSQVQAGFIFNFIKFTTWPPSEPPTRPFRIRILQNPVIARAMSEAPEQSIHDRSFDIRNCNTPAELLDAELVFIPTKAAMTVPADIWTGFGPTTMIVSDWDEALSKGGTVQLLTVGGKIRFAFNLKRCKGLNISSKLLRLATEVTE